jgi:hypothetical protein
MGDEARFSCDRRILPALLPVLAAALLAAPGAGARERVLKRQNFAFSVPEGSGWTDVAGDERWVDPAVLMTTGGREFVILVRDRPEEFGTWGKSAVRWVDGILEREISVGMEYTTAELHGLPALEFHGGIAREGQSGRIAGTLLLTDEYIYVIMCIAFSGDPREDDDLAAMRSSFRFLGPPEPPPKVQWITWVAAGITGLIVLGLGLFLREIIGRRGKEPRRRRMRVPPATPGAGGGA